MARRAEIIGWGKYVPSRTVSNAELAQRVATSDAWILERTGIARRHLASPRETTAHMAINAARAALQVANADPRMLDLIIVATATPDLPMPSTACLVQSALGATRAGAFDLNAACSGFVYGVVMGHQAIASGEHTLVLVIGADTLSRIVDWDDRNTCVLFGDGAGAVVLRASEGPAGILATLLRSDGSGADMLMVPAGGSARPATLETIERREHYIRMDGRGVFRFAARTVPRAIEQALSRAHLALRDVDLFIPHQANLRIIQALAERLGTALDRWAVNVQEYGNTSAASVPIALCEAIEAGRVQPGQVLVLAGFGAGLTWAIAVVRWFTPPPPARPRGFGRWLRWMLYRWTAIRTACRRLVRRAIVSAIRRTRSSDRAFSA